MCAGAYCPDNPCNQDVGPIKFSTSANEVTVPRLDGTEVRIKSSTGGEKGSKEARFDLIPVGPLTQLAKLYGRGAEKYAARNWERGYDWSLSYAAAQRHMTQFWAGEDIDEEMGLPHPVAAIFHMMALVQFLEQHPEFDDRPNPVSESKRFPQRFIVGADPSVPVTNFTGTFTDDLPNACNPLFQP